MNNTSFIDIEPIVKANREIFKEYVLMAGGCVFLEIPISFVDESGDKNEIFKVTYKEYNKTPYFHYRYGNNFQYFDWFLFDEMPLSVENEVMRSVINVI